MRRKLTVPRQRIHQPLFAIFLSALIRRFRHLIGVEQTKTSARISTTQAPSL
jgi:hypothetical protein